MTSAQPILSESRSAWRRIGGIAVGIVYGWVAWLSLTDAIGRLSRRGDHHYLILSASWLAAVATGSVLAARSWHARQRTAALLTMMPFEAVLVLLFRFASTSRIADWFWPPPRNWEYPLIAATIIVAFISGQAIKEQRDIEESLQQRFPERAKYVDESGIFGIAWKFWLWLWLPMFFWLGQLFTTLYYLWLNIALLGHRFFQPALWFDGNWDFSVSLADFLVTTALAALLLGVERATDAFRNPVTTATTKVMIKKFLGWGVALAFFGNLVFLHLAANVTNRLATVNVQGRPWWQFF